MKNKTLVLLTGLGVPLFHAATASAAFTGISTVSKPYAVGLLTVNVYAEFDRPGEEHMLDVAGTPNAPRSISVIGGTFYQHVFAIDRPPSCALGQCGTFPSLLFDTFVTIGVKAVGVGAQPDDQMVLTADWPGFGASTLATTNAGWAVTPIDPQGDPFDPIWAAGDGRTLIGQFSTLDGTAIQGTMLLSFISNGVGAEAVVSFLHVPGPGCLAALGLWGLSFQGRRRVRPRPLGGPYAACG